MKNDPQHIFEVLKNIKLDPNEGGVMKGKLLEFVANNPVRIVPHVRLNQGELVQSLFSKFILKTMPIALIVALLLGGGVTVSAEHALPGDALYPVKTQVNEKLAGLVAISTESKVAWDAKLVDRRLVEAEQLAAQSKFNDAAKTVIGESLKDIVAQANEHLSALQANDPEKAMRVSANISAALKAHDQILNSFEEEHASTTPEKTESVKNLHQQVKNELQGVLAHEHEISDDIARNAGMVAVVATTTDAAITALPVSSSTTPVKPSIIGGSQDDDDDDAVRAPTSSAKPSITGESRESKSSWKFWEDGDGDDD
ncbi:MAG: DUF5667 domain-containing protein [Minisyncoccia bacterium]